MEILVYNSYFKLNFVIEINKMATNLAASSIQKPVSSTQLFNNNYHSNKGKKF